MQKSKRYPILNIRSKNELAKHLSHKDFPKEEALRLLNVVIGNHDGYWRESKRSQPEKGKYVRDARGTPLGVLLKKINVRVLAPHDVLLPDFVFGGITGTNHVRAAKHLLGSKRKRSILKMDITTFYEQISEERVAYFFHKKCGCSEKFSKLISGLCCVPLGSKDSPSDKKTIGRGFATSSRLAIWCSLDIFIKIDRLVRKRLKGKDPKLAIYVDDIGITASRVSREELLILSEDIKKILLSDKNQPLPVKDEKTDVFGHQQGIEHLGLRLHRNKISLGKKTLSKKDKLKSNLGRASSKDEKSYLKDRLKSIKRYQGYVSNS